jgi:hypothetical protein
MASKQIVPVFVLWIFFVGKVPSSIGRLRKSGDHPYENLAKSENKPEMKYKSVIILLYVWLQTKFMNLANFTFFSSLGDRNSPKSLKTNSSFKFHFLAKFH